MRTAPLLLALAASLCASVAQAAPTSFTTNCTATNGALQIWNGTSDAGVTLRVESVNLGIVTKIQPLVTGTLTCNLNPQTSDAGLTADVVPDAVVLHLTDDGVPLGTIVAFANGNVHIDHQSSSTTAAHALLTAEGLLDAASAVHAQLDNGDVKDALASLL